VTNLENGRAVQVRINDRGPFVGGRAIDLSYAAARSVDMIGPGTARVRIEVIGRAAVPVVVPVAVATAAPVPAVARPAPELPTGSYTVEVAALSDPEKAQHLRQVLSRRFPDAFVAPLTGTSGQYYRVRIGPYPFRTAALERAERVTRLGYPAIIVDESLP
jgi:rare lipoprotein A